MCETNPILRLRIVDCGLKTDLPRHARSAPSRLGPARADCAKRTQFGEVKCAKRTQSGPTSRKGPGSPKGETCKTNPISGRGPAGRGLGTRDVVQTNPIPVIMPIRRSAFPGGKRAKRTQFPASGTAGRRPGDEMRKTNPIGLPPDRQTGPRLEPIMQNEPNSSTADFGLRIGDSPAACRLGRAKCAKQTQFRRESQVSSLKPEGPAASSRGLPAYPIVPMFHHSSPILIVQNEANFRPGPQRWMGNPPPYAGRTLARQSRLLLFGGWRLA